MITSQMHLRRCHGILGNLIQSGHFSFWRLLSYLSESIVKETLNMTLYFSLSQSDFLFIFIVKPGQISAEKCLSSVYLSGQPMTAQDGIMKYTDLYLMVFLTKINVINLFGDFKWHLLYIFCNVDPKFVHVSYITVFQLIITDREFLNKSQLTRVIPICNNLLNIHSYSW